MGFYSLLCSHVNSKMFFYFCDDYHWNFDGDCFESAGCFEQGSHFLQVILVICLLVSALNLFFSVFKRFSLWWSFISLIGFIPRYFCNSSFSVFV